MSALGASRARLSNATRLPSTDVPRGRAFGGDGLHLGRQLTRQANVGGGLRALIQHADLVGRFAADLDRVVDVDHLEQDRGDPVDQDLLLFLHRQRPLGRAAEAEGLLPDLHRHRHQLDRAGLVDRQLGQGPVDGSRGLVVVAVVVGADELQAAGQFGDQLARRGPGPCRDC